MIDDIAVSPYDVTPQRDALARLIDKARGIKQEEVFYPSWESQDYDLPATFLASPSDAAWSLLILHAKLAASGY